MPESHQENNAQYIYERNAAIVIDESDITPETLAKAVRKILFDNELQKKMQANIHAIMPAGATENLLKIIHKLLNE